MVVKWQWTLYGYIRLTSAWPSATAQGTAAVLQMRISLSQADLEEKAKDAKTYNVCRHYK